MTSSLTRLRLFLSVDAAATAAMALLLLTLAPWLGGMFTISPALLRGAGWLLLAFAAALAWAATQQHPPVRLVWALVIGNTLWVVDSVILLFTPWLAPNNLGIGFVLAQAAAVGLFAVAEFSSLRKLRPALPN